MVIVDVELKHENMSDAELVCCDIMTTVVKTAHMQLLSNICRAMANNLPWHRLTLLVLAYRAEDIAHYEDDVQLSFDEDEIYKINNLRCEVLQVIAHTNVSCKYFKEHFERASIIVMTAILDTPLDKRKSRISI